MLSLRLTQWNALTATVAIAIYLCVRDLPTNDTALPPAEEAIPTDEPDIFNGEMATADRTVAHPGDSEICTFS